VTPSISKHASTRLDLQGATRIEPGAWAATPIPIGRYNRASLASGQEQQKQHEAGPFMIAMDPRRRPKQAVGECDRPVENMSRRTVFEPTAIFGAVVVVVCGRNRRPIQSEAFGESVNSPLKT